MKKYLLLILMLITILTGCKAKKESEQTSNINTNEENISEIAKEMRKEPQWYHSTDSVIILSGKFLYEVDDDGYLIPTYNCDVGDKISIFTDESYNPIEKMAQVKNPDGTITNKKVSYIYYSHGDYELNINFSLSLWVDNSVIASEPNTKFYTAVAANDLNIYLSNDFSSITDQIIEKGSYVAVTEPCPGDLIKACLYDGNSYGRIVYIDQNLITNPQEMELLVLQTKMANQSLQDEVRHELEEVIEDLKKEIYKQEHYYEY